MQWCKGNHSLSQNALKWYTKVQDIKDKRCIKDLLDLLLMFLNQSIASAVFLNDFRFIWFLTLYIMQSNNCLLIHTKLVFVGLMSLHFISLKVS